MTEKFQLYRCNLCGNLVEVVLSGSGELVCCGQPMEYLSPQTRNDESGEKHIPVKRSDDSGKNFVRVGVLPHPMQENHYIKFVETISSDSDMLSRQYLHVGAEPVAFKGCNTKNSDLRAYCNLHGLWEGKSD